MRILINSYLKIDKNESTIKTAYSDFLIQQKNAYYQLVILNQHLLLT